MTNVHGHRPDRTANDDGVTLREELVLITVLTGPLPGPRRVRSDRIASARDGHPIPVMTAPGSLTDPARASGVVSA